WRNRLVRSWKPSMMPSGSSPGRGGTRRAAAGAGRASVTPDADAAGGGASARGAGVTGAGSEPARSGRGGGLAGFASPAGSADDGARATDRPSLGADGWTGRARPPLTSHVVGESGRGLVSSSSAPSFNRRARRPLNSRPR